jgi:ABC-2 type transport system ATP-binding protein
MFGIVLAADGECHLRRDVHARMTIRTRSWTMSMNAAPARADRHPVLVARGLHKAYGATPALRGVNLQIDPGDLVVMVGPNGAGKSTLMQLLTGLFDPDAGDIEVLGHPMRAAPDRALAALGVVFQQGALDLDLSVQANLLFHTDLHGLPRALARERIAQGLVLLGLQAHAGSAVRTLSGGNRRKVELVRALLHAPRELLLAEATVGLDPPSRQALLDTVRRLSRDTGVGVLWATHLLDEALHADRVIALQAGEIRFDGPPAAFAASG